MTVPEDWANRLRDALAEARTARNSLDKTMVRVIADARADAPLRRLRYALKALDQLASKLP